MREELMLKLKEKGLSYKAIAEQNNISRQRVHFLLKRKYGAEQLKSLYEKKPNKDIKE